LLTLSFFGELFPELALDFEDDADLEEDDDFRRFESDRDDDPESLPIYINWVFYFRV
jgi:hypothetical protein